MILVDTSILIDFLSGRKSRQIEKFEYLLRSGITFGINNYIYQELLQGAKTDKEFRILKEYLETQKFYKLLHGRQSFTNAASIYYKCRKKGITIRSTVDLIIVETVLENELMLFHNDSEYTNIAKIIHELKFY